MNKLIRPGNENISLAGAGESSSFNYNKKTGMPQ
jgi:hypothetical protein